MINTLFVCVIAVNTVIGSPQFVTFKDGKVGVNFGGYTAEAGLGGLLTGNVADGGLSASAGTPFGQRAAAGLSGRVNGNAAGTAYAGAQATDTIGASAIIGGSSDSHQGGLIGAEAHSNGKAVNKIITGGGTVRDSPPSADGSTLIVPTDVPKQHAIQKVKPPKKYATASSIDNRFNGNEQEIRTTTLYKNVQSNNPDINTFPQNQQTIRKEVRLNPGALDHFFNIPIGILQSIRDNLQPVGGRKQLFYTKTV